MIGVSGLNSVGEDNKTMFKTYRGPLLINSLGYELPSGTCLNSDLSVASSCVEERDARDTIHLQKDAMRKDAMEYWDLLVRASTKQELKIAGCVVAYNAGDMDKVSGIH